MAAELDEPADAMRDQVLAKLDQLTKLALLV